MGGLLGGSSRGIQRLKDKLKPIANELAVGFRVFFKLKIGVLKMTNAELLHKRILILESRALKLARANKDGLFAFMVRNEHWTETRGDRSRYRRLHTLCQRVSERSSHLYERLLELIKPQIEDLICEQMDRTNGDADWAKRRLRGSFNWDDSLNDVILTEAIREINRRQQQAKAWYVPKART